ncbi:unnamed protein product [Clonostachys rosea]|uniref:Zn(2)-C6 fungal-type domain-containing protein n=1 Tax=Bionectria ochroleuca TaxID=29856 RepID=A0ABY6U682_BIOOC|nr:unnamed protein product [Clonostachys rosea]
MPSAPRSKACQVCKARRIKGKADLYVPKQCDQTWPTCTPCKLKNVECPGPSVLTKFVNFDPKSSDSVTRSKDTNGQPSPQIPQAAKGAELQPTTRKKIKFRVGGQNEDQAYYHTFRLYAAKPAPNLTTAAERVSARLITHLNNASSRGILTLLEYLRDLPQHMNDNPSLRDSVDLFCTAWAFYRRGQEADKFMDMPAYGKAIRSLRRTLQSDKAITLQTLASMIILGRAAEFFDPGRNMGKSMHEKGLACMIMQLGVPKPDDHLHRFLMVEAFGILLPYFITTGETNFLNHPPWGDIIKDCIIEKSNGTHLLLPLLVHCAIGDRIPRILHECPILRQNPLNPETFNRAMLMIAELQQMDDDADKALPQAIENCVRAKQMVERPDPDSITGTSYDFPNIFVPRILMALCYMKLGILRMRYDWSDIYNLPNKAALYEKARSLCIHLWKYIPYLLRLETFIASIFHFGLYATFEFATRAEKEYLLDFFAETDRYKRQFPLDRDELEETIIYHAKLVTGRLSLPDVATQCTADS